MPSPSTQRRTYLMKNRNFANRLIEIQRAHFWSGSNVIKNNAGNEKCERESSYGKGKDGPEGAIQTKYWRLWWGNYPDYFAERLTQMMRYCHEITSTWPLEDKFTTLML